MYYQREIEKKINKYIDSPEIIAIFGSRQVGKTTILKHIYHNSENALFLTFDDIETKILFQEDIKSFIKLYIEPYDRIFIDEFQYVTDGGKHLKNFNSLENKVDKAAILENFVFRELVDKDVKYYRNKNGS
ncbi:AAA family ATPase [Candidatus Marithrix sp. Canyon 246]|uniref:AAA family ATPase n=1 Tax=Candidatus Marithrix sp. Canyon 246 TaxID=1827136 RepID=UPI00084A020B|nr:AAA family ATPase [Candidatus Marithrix sp. Canyon 246]